jgi:hypothetical protein
MKEIAFLKIGDKVTLMSSERARDLYQNIKCFGDTSC